MSTKKYISELTTQKLDDLKKTFECEKRNTLAQNVVSKSSVVDASLSRLKIQSVSHIFNHKVEEFKPVTNQRSSGRCWLFACLNAMRIPFMKARKLEEFEFSQAYLFFWDKIERSNYFLNSIVEVNKREAKNNNKNDVEGRLLSFILSSETCLSDGGQWDMVANIINKYGVVPKKCFPESFSCEASSEMNSILRSKLREFAHELHVLMEDENTNIEDVLNAKIDEQMKHVYTIVSICLGTPPSTFTWEFYDKNKAYNCIGKDITPQKFYAEYVKPHFNVDDKVCLVSDPRPENKTGVCYTVDFLGNVVGGRETIYNNQPIQILMEMAAKSISERNEPVWFGCDVGKHFARKQGVLDLDIHEYELTLGSSINRVLNKSDRLRYGASKMAHAMVLTAYNDNHEHKEATTVASSEDNKSTDSGKNVDKVDPEKIKTWRIENSWGEDRNDKGYIVMTNDWFKEFVYEVVVDKSVVPQNILDAFSIEPIVLPAWDPMGALARSQ